MKNLALTFTLILFVTIGYSQSKKFDTYAYYNRATGYVSQSPYPLTISKLSNGIYQISYRLQDGIYTTFYEIKVEYVKKLEDGVSYEYVGTVKEDLYLHNENKISTRTYNTTLWTATPLSKFINENIGYPGYGLYERDYVIRYTDFDENNFDIYIIK